MHAREDVVLIVGAQILQFAEITEGDRYFSGTGIVEREVGSGNAVIRGQHARHDVGAYRRSRNHRAC
jgi:hypothetical protein